MTSFALDLARSALAMLFVVYTVIAVSHYAAQLIFAHRTWRRQRSPEFAAEHPDLDMAVDIVIPVYNETPALLRNCVLSALAQDHRGPVKVIVVDDGSPNRASLDATYDQLEGLGAVIVRSPRNQGKRHAQALALPLCEGEILVTLDSDSVLASNAVRRLTRQFNDPKVGSATGVVDVKNRDRNLLTRIQRVRYWMAFNQERAAQTFFRTVMCCSGPLAAYRRELVERVREAYLTQTYGGVLCTYGDDRHLTNLILAQGYDSVFDAGAVAWTHVPETLPQFLRQQLRWNKSFYRELIWTLPFIQRRPWYSRFDLACQVGMPIMLTLTAGSALLMGMATNPAYLLRYALLIALAAAVRATYAVVRERDPRYYFFILYGFVSAVLLVSVRLRALSTLADARWGTRGPARDTGGNAPGMRPALGPMGLVSATAGVEWPASPFATGPSRFDGAWRAGLVTRQMAHPMASAAPGGRGRPAAISGDCDHRDSRSRLANFCRVCGATLRGLRALD